MFHLILNILVLAGEGVDWIAGHHEADSNEAYDGAEFYAISWLTATACFARYKDRLDW